VDMPDNRISSVDPDFSREKIEKGKYQPEKRLLHTIRLYQVYKERKGIFSLLLSKITVVRYRFWSAVCGADIPLDTTIGYGLLIPHPNGIVIHPDTVIGPNCLILQQVTLGTRGPGSGAPVLEGHVDIGAGAKVLGGVHLGAHCKVGANSVVVCDVPGGATAVGVPARIIRSTGSSDPNSP